jgi:CHASE2 domain-containing sensor protein
MSELEEKLSNVLNNPQLMQQIMSMAQSVNSAPSPPEANTGHIPMPEPDINLIRQLSAMAQKGTIDPNQQSLLKALGPYLSPERIEKLKKAMRAAKMAQFATVFLNSGQLQPGR